MFTFPHNPDSADYRFDSVLEYFRYTDHPDHCWAAVIDQDGIAASVEHPDRAHACAIYTVATTPFPDEADEMHEARTLVDIADAMIQHTVPEIVVDLAIDRLYTLRALSALWGEPNGIFENRAADVLEEVLTEISDLSKIAGISRGLNAVRSRTSDMKEELFDAAEEDAIYVLPCTVNNLRFLADGGR